LQFLLYVPLFCINCTSLPLNAPHKSISMAIRFESNLLNVGGKYLEQLKIPVSKSTLKKRLEAHPFYPSLYSLSSVFRNFNIENESFEVGNENFKDFEPPYIAYYKEKDSAKDFILVTHANNTHIGYIAGNNKTIQVSRNEFFEKFQNIIFAAEGDSSSGEKEYVASLSTERLARNKKNALVAGGILLLCMLWAPLFYHAGTQWPYTVVTSITKLAGFALCILLLMYETDKTNKLVKNICTGGKQFNCDAVIGSKGAQFFGIGWSDAGFCYFATTSLFLLFPGISFGQKMPPLSLSALAVSPYIIFSIYYQWRVVKQWCPLCLLVQSVLVIECIWSLFYFSNNGFSFPVLNVWMAGATSVLLPVITWILLKPVIRKAQASPLYEAAYKRLLNHPDLINGQLQQQETVPDGWQQLGIVLGNKNAPHTILKVCNPFCGPCSFAHKALDEILHHNPDVKLQILFTTTVNETDRGLPVVRHLLAIDEKKQAGKTEQALDDWYLAEKKDYDQFAKNYPMNGELTQQDEKIKAMSKWCDDAGIFYTPTIFVNGKRLPESYDASILKNIF
jgi:uncharacterized membrane protein